MFAENGHRAKINNNKKMYALCYELQFVYNRKLNHLNLLKTRIFSKKPGKAPNDRNRVVENVMSKVSVPH